MPEYALSKWDIPYMGYFVPGRDAPRAWPNGESCWNAAVVAAVTWNGYVPKSEDFNQIWLKNQPSNEFNMSKSENYSTLACPNIPEIISFQKWNPMWKLPTHWEPSFSEMKAPPAASYPCRSSSASGGALSESYHK